MTRGSEWHISRNARSWCWTILGQISKTILHDKLETTSDQNKASKNMPKITMNNSTEKQMEKRCYNRRATLCGDFFTQSCRTKEETPANPQVVRMMNHDDKKPRNCTEVQQDQRLLASWQVDQNDKYWQMHGLGTEHSTTKSFDKGFCTITRQTRAKHKSKRDIKKHAPDQYD